MTGHARAVQRRSGRTLTFNHESQPLVDLTFDISDIHAIRTTGAIILMIAYGYSVKEHDDFLVDVVEAAVNGFSECMEPGAHLVDMIPLCKSLFLPGAPVRMPTAPSLLSTSSAIRP